jgi:hypothetical protein
MTKPRRRRATFGSCVLCSETGPLTEEHIPPQNLWPRKRSIRNRCLSVPACQKCNNESARDDEYFRIVVAQSAETGDHPEVKTIQPEINRSIERVDFPGLKRVVLGRAFPVEQTTEAGLFIGRRLAHMVDAKRVGAVINKTVRGLYYLESGAIMPRAHRVTFIVPESLAKFPLAHRVQAIEYANVLLGLPLKAGGPGKVFRYSHFFEEKPDGVASLWLLVFFERFSFLAMGVPPSVPVASS